MKLNKTLLAFIAIILFLVPAYFLWSSYKIAVTEQRAVEENLNNARILYNAGLKERTNLNQQLTDVEATIKLRQNQLVALQNDLLLSENAAAKAKTSFPSVISSIDYDELLMGLAKTSGVEVTNLSTSELAGVDLTGVPFVSATFTLDIRGPTPGILDLINRLATDQAIRSGRVESVTLTIPEPVTQATKDEIAAKLKADRLDEVAARISQSITTEQRIGFIERAILDVLDETPGPMTNEEMTILINEKIATSPFGPKIADQFSRDIALALEKQVAGALTSAFAQLYGEAIGALFKAGEPTLTPFFLGNFGEIITLNLKDIPPNAVAGIVSGLIADKINTLTAQYASEYVTMTAAEKVDYSGIDQQVAASIAEAEKASASIGLTVLAYSGTQTGR
jgi:hypothetical protein